jgi:tRNA-intron endonuclease
MIEEIAQAMKGKLLKKGVFVSEASAVGELESRGYGVKFDQRLLLLDYEALFLMHVGKLLVTKSGGQISLKRMVDFALERDPSAWTRFLVYRDLRSRGYTVKEGFGFGVDFRVYDRGEYGQKPAKFVVFALNEGSTEEVQELTYSIEQISRMGKEPVVAVIERRGEVIYYRVSKMRFREA